ncbi:hypothetical protein BB559_004411 [Furculomyces boomerangus]|uniref:Acyl-coenzyme A oxidase n=1 Tax=Furculomyces boomerangus TaxID=61424 RepID=A0A2T9YEV6_9FUNG|nr:hypothetical protein BB559_006607 [Furculomyces boomerangus]PVU90877.1 hypothetical protein BB559_004411 [Furculomyces boomerangus]
MKFPTDLVKMEPHTSVTLQKEREKANFPVQEMGKFILGEEYIANRERGLEIIRSEPETFDNKEFYFMSRTEKMEKAYQREKRVLELLREGKIKSTDIRYIYSMLDWVSPFDLSRGMFVPTIAQQGTEEQKKAFLEPALKYQIVGCYAQTEMGHGSNIRGLETTATFIEETDEFEMNSPSLTSTKWWIGSLGVSSTHACVMAQIYVKGKHVGLFPVIVPIRSLIDHKPLPGVTVGDIGPKMGYNTMDNGFLNLNKVRVPRFNLLQKYVSVSRTGEVTRPANINSRASYGTMVLVRASIANNMGKQLAKGVTVAVRYTAVRRQFGEPGKPETPVLDYGIVQYRVIPILAKTYAMLGMSHEFMAQYEKSAALIRNGDFSMLKEMHAVSCGLKRWSSDTCIYGVDTCRHVCGGHGFSQFSGLNEFWATIYPAIIFEGDNYVLAKQVASYLVKSAYGLRNKEEIDSNDTTNMFRHFMNMDSKLSPAQLYTWSGKSAQEIASNENVLLDLLGYRVISMVHDLAVKIYGKGQTMEESSVPSQGIATVHSEYIVCSYFNNHINKLPQGSPLRPILKALFKITALSFLTRNTGELYGLPSKASVTREQINGLESEYIESIKAVREQAVPLVDALGVPDEKLNSSLGRYDGNVYEDYMERALSEPLNRDGTGEEIRKRFYDKYIGPTIHASSNNQTKL